MAKYRIRGALSGGFGGCEFVEWEEVECRSDEQAQDWAYELACEVYVLYDGNNGLRSVDDIMEEEEVEQIEAEDIWIEEREDWLDYEYEKVEEE